MEDKAIPRGYVVLVESDNTSFVGAVAGALIRLLSGARVQHVAVSLGDGRMINAQFQGVCYSNAQEGAEIFGKLPDGLIEPVIACMEQQLGKPYDFLHLIADPYWNVTGKDLGCSVPRAFICSTLVAYALQQCGGGRFLPKDKPFAAITPGDFRNTLPAVTL